MDQTACVDIQNLPLQVLLRSYPAWKDDPVVVVDRDKPNGTVLYVNERARAYRILPGLRYGAGLGLCRGLRGGVVNDEEIERTVNLVTARLWSYSPRIEPSPREPGVFWLDASGLLQLYPSLDDWAQEIRRELGSIGFQAVVAVGFSRFGSYAAAKATTQNIVFQNPEQEQRHLYSVPIGCLALDPKLRDILFELGIEDLGGFIELPAESIRKRFGAEADELHRLARGNCWTPLNPRVLLEPVERIDILDYPEGNIDRLLARLFGLLESILREVSGRHEKLKSIRIWLKLDDGRKQHATVSPAMPTLDIKQLLELLRLRLENISLSSGVVELKIRGDGAAASHRQLDLFREVPQRNIEAAHRAFARIRSQLGADAVVYARLHGAHLPEAQYHWETLKRLRHPRLRPILTRPLVRRMFSPPIELPPRERNEPDGWLIAGVSEGPVDEVKGPHLVSGGWWMREVSRAYHYVHTRSGRWLWIYHDHKRRRWFLHGEVQ